MGPGRIHRPGAAGHRHRGQQPLRYPDPQRRDVQPLRQRPAAAGHHHPGHPGRDLRRHRQGAGLHQRGVGHLVRPQLFHRTLRQPDHHLRRPRHRRGSGVHRPHPGRRGLRRDQPGADPPPSVGGRRQPGQGGHHLPGVCPAVRGHLCGPEQDRFLVPGAGRKGQQRRQGVHRAVRLRPQRHQGQRPAVPVLVPHLPAQLSLRGVCGVGAGLYQCGRGRLLRAGKILRRYPVGNGRPDRHHPQRPGQRHRGRRRRHLRRQGRRQPGADAGHHHPGSGGKIPERGHRRQHRREPGLRRRDGRQHRGHPGHGFQAGF